MLHNFMATASFRLSSLAAPPRSQKFGGFSEIFGRGEKLLEGILKVRGLSKNPEGFQIFQRGFKNYILLMAALQFRYAHVYTSFTLINWAPCWTSIEVSLWKI